MSFDFRVFIRIDICILFDMFFLIIILKIYYFDNVMVIGGVSWFRDYVSSSLFKWGKI